MAYWNANFLGRMLPGLAKRSHFRAISERLNGVKSLRNAHALETQNCEEGGTKKNYLNKGKYVPL